MHTPLLCQRFAANGEGWPAALVGLSSCGYLLGECGCNCGWTPPAVDQFTVVTWCRLGWCQLKLQQRILAEDYGGVIYS
jgi:hypothetical protein